jgi:hypothetical protein
MRLNMRLKLIVLGVMGAGLVASCGTPDRASLATLVPSVTTGAVIRETSSAPTAPIAAAIASATATPQAAQATASPHSIAATPSATSTAVPRQPTRTAESAMTNTPAALPAATQAPRPPQIVLDKTPIVPEPIALPGETYQPPYPPGIDQLVQQALNDLAARLSIGTDAIGIDLVRSVVWPDGSLGCPSPDRSHPQVTVEGLIIRLAVASQSYEYHSGNGKAPFLCEH